MVSARLSMVTKWVQDQFGQLCQTSKRGLGWGQGCGCTSMVGCLPNTGCKALGSTPVLKKPGTWEIYFPRSRKAWLKTQPTLKEQRDIMESVRAQMKHGKPDVWNSSPNRGLLSHRLPQNSTLLLFDLHFYHSLRNELKQNFMLHVSNCERLKDIKIYWY